MISLNTPCFFIFLVAAAIVVATETNSSSHDNHTLLNVKSAMIDDDFDDLTDEIIEDQNLTSENSKIETTKTSETTETSSITETSIITTTSVVPGSSDIPESSTIAEVKFCNINDLRIYDIDVGELDDSYPADDTPIQLKCNHGFVVKSPKTMLSVTCTVGNNGAPMWNLDNEFEASNGCCPSNWLYDHRRNRKFKIKQNRRETHFNVDLSQDVAKNLESYTLSVNVENPTVANSRTHKIVLKITPHLCDGVTTDFCRQLNISVTNDLDEGLMANKSFLLQTRKSQLSLNWRVQMRKRSDAQGFAQKGVVKLIRDITTDLLTVEMSDDVPEMLIIDRYADDRLVVTNVQPYNGKKESENAPAFVCGYNRVVTDWHQWLPEIDAKNFKLMLQNVFKENVILDHDKLTTALVHNHNTMKTQPFCSQETLSQFNVEIMTAKRSSCTLNCKSGYTSVNRQPVFLNCNGTKLGYDNIDYKSNTWSLPTYALSPPCLPSRWMSLVKYPDFILNSMLGDYEGDNVVDNLTVQEVALAENLGIVLVPFDFRVSHPEGNSIVYKIMAEFITEENEVVSVTQTFHTECNFQKIDCSIHFNDLKSMKLENVGVGSVVTAAFEIDVSSKKMMFRTGAIDGNQIQTTNEIHVDNIDDRARFISKVSIEGAYVQMRKPIVSRHVTWDDALIGKYQQLSYCITFKLLLNQLSELRMCSDMQLDDLMTEEDFLAANLETDLSEQVLIVANFMKVLNPSVTRGPDIIEHTVTTTANGSEFEPQNYTTPSNQNTNDTFQYSTDKFQDFTDQFTYSTDAVLPKSEEEEDKDSSKLWIILLVIGLLLAVVVMAVFVGVYYCLKNRRNEQTMNQEQMFLPMQPVIMPQIEPEQPQPEHKKKHATPPIEMKPKTEKISELPSMPIEKHAEDPTQSQHEVSPAVVPPPVQPIVVKVVLSQPEAPVKPPVEVSKPDITLASAPNVINDNDEDTNTTTTTSTMTTPIVEKKKKKKKKNDDSVESDTETKDEYLGDVVTDFVDRLGNVRWQKK